MEFDKNGIERQRGTFTWLFSRGKKVELLRLETYNISGPQEINQLPASLVNEGVSQTGGIDNMEDGEYYPAYPITEKLPLVHDTPIVLQQE